MAVLVRNMSKGPAVHTDPVNKTSVTWMGAGDPQGKDVQYVPDSFMDNPEFIQSMNAGIYVVLMTKEEIQAQRAIAPNFAQVQAQRDAEALAAIDTSTQTPINIVNVDEGGNVTQFDPNQPVPAGPAI